MKVSMQWLKDYVQINERASVVADKFTLYSQEVEYTKQLVDATKLVVGYVKSCEAHPDADKLSVCKVDVGTEVLTIVCGAPNVDQGQHVIVARVGAVLPGDFEIKEATIRGVDSSGMICSLDELGIEHKYHNESGIHVIEGEVTVGANALSALYLDDEIIALDLTPNRMDLLSMHGVAYDVAAIFDKELNIPEVRLTYSDLKNPMKIRTETAACMSYYGSVIDDIEVRPSPLWMRARLIAAGVRPINNVVDITNYVMIETGQPLHAFDYDLFDSDEVVVRLAKHDETFVTLDDKTRVLTDQDILITNGKRPVALGGVMGGADTEVHDQTRTILLESAAFNPLNVRKTSTRLDLRSESSLRFEKGIDLGKTKYALDRATELLIKYANASVRKDVAYFNHVATEEKVIDVTLDKINRVLGSAYTEAHVAHVLKRLRFDFTVSDGCFNIVKPSRRPDFETYQDIIEEVGRISGYGDLPATLPRTVTVGALTPLQKFRRSLRRLLNGLGLDEVITYNLQDSEKVHKLVLDKTLQPIKVKHPMSQNRNVLRLSPLYGMVEAVSYNVARRRDSVHIFELGTRYTEHHEREVLSIAMHGTYQNRYWQSTQTLNFYTIKGIFEAVCKHYNIDSLRYEQIEADDYHPYQTARIFLEDQAIGHIGKMHPSLSAELDLADVYLLEVDLENLAEHAEALKPYEAIERYPSVERDIAIVVSEDIAAGKIIDMIRSHAQVQMKEAVVFDVYVGERLGKGLKSLGIRMVFSDPNQTLKAEVIDDEIQHLIEILEKEYDAKLR